ncbi:DUF5615 family PIN-like protein [Candidatus Gottesmanbacteria bacterium]|nr:DUF5615 family PIN-like protein [Candidatus Gottesmanbacteria bacterium]
MRHRRFKLLLDENMAPRERFPILNSRHDVRHLVHDLNLSGITDDQVYAIARKTRRIIVTFNRKHFAPMSGKSKETGIFAVSPTISNGQIDTKVVALLSHHPPLFFYGKIQMITGSI